MIAPKRHSGQADAAVAADFLHHHRLVAAHEDVPLANGRWNDEVQVGGVDVAVGDHRAFGEPGERGRDAGLAGAALPLRMTSSSWRRPPMCGVAFDGVPQLREVRAVLGSAHRRSILAARVGLGDAAVVGDFEQDRCLRWRSSVARGRRRRRRG